MENSGKKTRAELQARPEYAKATASYSNAFVNGAGRQKPGTVGFDLWFLFDEYYAAKNREPTSEEAVAIANAYKLNPTSAKNARLKWGAYHALRRERRGQYAQGPA